eukprot:6192872-Pleurochrysis_carterae.AAC.4
MLANARQIGNRPFGRLFNLRRHIGSPVPAPASRTAVSTDIADVDQARFGVCRGENGEGM